MGHCLARKREIVMPLARIDISEDAPPERIKVVSEAIYSAMVEIANVPLLDKFQVVTPTRLSIRRRDP
jgi:hypothetical protein